MDTGDVVSLLLDAGMGVLPAPVQKKDAHTVPISRVSEEPVYLISEEQLQLLQRKKLPFQVVVHPQKTIPFVGETAR